MSIQFEDMVKDALQLNATRAAMIDVSKIKFSKELRRMCKQNLCGSYGTNWMCPPGIGELGELIEKVSRYSHGLLFQTVHQLEDSFDIDGMEKGKKINGEVVRDVLDMMGNKYHID